MNQPCSTAASSLLMQLFGTNSDFTHREAVLFGQNVDLYYFHSIVDYQKTHSLLLSISSAPQSDETNLVQAVLSFGGKVNVSLQELAESLLQGNLIIVPREGLSNLVFHAVQYSIERDIDSPQNENIIQAPFDAFTEAMATNVGLLRRKFVNTRFTVKSYSVGTINPRQISVCYLEGTAVKSVVSDIAARMEQMAGKEIRTVHDLIKALGLPIWTPMPIHISSELPSETALHLEEGRVVVFLDQYPFALTFPVIIKDLWTLHADFNYPLLFTFAIRFMRILGIVIASIMPGLYVALVNVNPESLRIQLALSVAKSREGVPYPAIIEVVMMLFVLEMIVESSIRLPKSIGPTVTMVGAIVLGQAIVQAELVSNLLIIIVAVTAISNFTMVGFQNTILIRLLKYVMLLLGSMFGVFGIAVGIVLICLYFSGITVFQVPYLSFHLKGRNDRD